MKVPKFLAGLLPGVLRTVGSALPLLKGPADELAKAIDGGNLTPEQQAALEAELHAFEIRIAEIAIEEQRLDVEALKTIVAESVAEIQSPDKYVSRARPTGFYAFVLACLVAMGGLVFGWVPTESQATVVAMILGALGGNAAWYAKLRSDDKKEK